jgi:predicted dehydrogenase
MQAAVRTAEELYSGGRSIILRFMADTDITAAVVGTGHLGRHHVRILAGMEGVRCIGAYDKDRERLAEITAEHGVPALESVEAAGAADAVVIATPTVSHREVAGALLGDGCHVLVEKPITATVAEAEELIGLADRASKVLAVGHVEYHNPAVQAALGLADGVRYLESQRLSPFTARSVDVDVILDLMIHDLQITLAVAGEAPSEIRAVGVPVLTDKVDLCHAWVEFPGGLVANLTASRVSTERVRKLRLFARAPASPISRSTTPSRACPRHNSFKARPGSRLLRAWSRSKRTSRSRPSSEPSSPPAAVKRARS